MQKPKTFERTHHVTHRHNNLLLVQEGKNVHHITDRTSRDGFLDKESHARDAFRAQNLGVAILLERAVKGGWAAHQDCIWGDVVGQVVQVLFQCIVSVPTISNMWHFNEREVQSDSLVSM